MNAQFTFNSKQFLTVKNDYCAKKQIDHFPKRVIVKRVVKNIQGKIQKSILLKQHQQKHYLNNLQDEIQIKLTTNQNNKQIIPSIRKYQSDILQQNELKTKSHLITRKKCQNNSLLFQKNKKDKMCFNDNISPITISNSKIQKQLNQNRQKRIFSMRLSPKIVPICNKKLPDVFNLKLKQKNALKYSESCQQKNRIFSALTKIQSQPLEGKYKYIKNKKVFNVKFLQIQDRIFNQLYKRNQIN